MTGQAGAARVRRSMIRMIGLRGTFKVERACRRAIGHLTWRARPVRPPVFLWGAGRTGSYLLYDMLSLHPDLISKRSWERSSKGLYGTQHHGGGEYDSILENPFPPIEAAKHHVLMSFPQVRDTHRIAPENLPLIERRFRIEAACGLGARRLLDKAPHYTCLVEDLDRIFPEALHVHCIRHPAAVAASYYRRMCEPGSLDKYGYWGTRPHGWEAYTDRNVRDRSVWQAMAMIRQGLTNELHLGNRCMQVKYEDITAAPHEVFSRVLEHLQLSAPAGLVESFPETFPNYNPKQLDLDEVSEDLREELFQLTEELGYDTSFVTVQ